MSHRYFLSLLILTHCCFVFGAGCVAKRAGTISVSDSLVWQDHAVAAASNEPYRAIQKIGKDASDDLRKFQGRRDRRYYEVRGFRGTVKIQLPSGTTMTGEAPTSNPSAESDPSAETPATDSNQPTLLDAPELPPYEAVSGLPSPQQSAGLKIDEVAGDAISEDPIDQLQRADDFHQILSGLKLTHLRDTLSMQPGWSTYLLKLNISLLPGDKTQQEYGARVAFRIPDANDQVRVYSISPERYADRFQEVSSLRDDFKLALQAAVQGPQQSGSAAFDLAQRYEEDLTLIQRYPLISGFIDGQTDTFGWEFNPRLRIVTKDRIWPLTDKQEHVYWLEPGIRHVYALLAIKDCRIEVDKTLRKLSDKDLLKILEREPLGGSAHPLLPSWADLQESYREVREGHLVEGCEPERISPDTELNNTFAKIESMHTAWKTERKTIEKELDELGEKKSKLNNRSRTRKKSMRRSQNVVRQNRRP